jgi:hypothetical protein
MIGFGVWYFFYMRKKGDDGDVVSKAWECVNTYWTEKMKQPDLLKLDGAIVKAAYFTSTSGDPEMFVGFNVTKQFKNSRICFVVGTKPLGVKYINNSINIGEEDNPFKGFYAIDPTPIANFDDTSLKTKLAGVPMWHRPRQDEKKPQQGDWIEEEQPKRQPNA